MAKFFKEEGMRSSGEATPSEVKQGYYNADHQEPELTFEQFMEQERARDNFGGVVGRPTGHER